MVPLSDDRRRAKAMRAPRPRPDSFTLSPLLMPRPIPLNLSSDDIDPIGDPVRIVSCISSSNELFNATVGFSLGCYSMSMYFNSGGASDVPLFIASISSLSYLSLAS